MKKLILFLSFFIFSCTNNELYKPSLDSVLLTPNVLELNEYTGELISFHLNNPTSNSFHLNPDITLYTKVDGKEYLVQRKNEITVKPSASFSFSVGGNTSYDEASLGFVIESSKELLVFNHKDFDIRPYSDKNISLSINIKNLYYTKNSQNILVSDEELYGYISLYHDDDIFRIIPFKLKLKNSLKENLQIDFK